MELIQILYSIKSLYINPIRIEKIFDLSEDQTITLLDELMEYVNSLKFEYRHRWKVGDFVILRMLETL